jgi:hypothetical protein
MSGKVSLVSTGRAVASLRESDFDTCSAVGEVIDNSLQAESSNIKMVLHEKEISGRGITRGTKVVHKCAFGDDGIGMDADTLHHCLQLGFSSRYNDRKGIGRFGVGMTLAAISQCQRIEIYSKTKGTTGWLKTHIDLEEIVDDPNIPEPAPSELPDEYRDLAGAESGTLVVWDKFDRQPDSLENVKHWVRRTYRKFIGTERVENGKIIVVDNAVSIVLNGEILTPFDPLYAVTNPDIPTEDRAQLFEIIEFDMPIPDDAGVDQKTSKVIVQMSFTPESWRPEGGGASGRTPEAKAAKLDENEGFSVLRANREVFYDSMGHFKPKVHADGLDRWWSAEILFEPVLDRYFSVRNIKRGARFVRQLREEIENVMTPTIKQCRKDVAELWARNKQNDVEEKTETQTSHEEAQTAVKTSNPVPGKAGVNKTEEQKVAEVKEILSPIVKSEAELNAWLETINSNPCTIIDNEGTRWKGNTFLDIIPQGGTTIIEYNRSHDFFRFIYEQLADLEDARAKKDHDGVAEIAHRLKVAIDLLFMAYSKAEGALDPEHEQPVEDTLEFLRANWGSHLRNFVRSYLSSKK